MPSACCLLDHLIRPLEHADWNYQTDLFRRLQIDDEFKLRCLLHRQISRLGAFQGLLLSLPAAILVLSIEWDKIARRFNLRMQFLLKSIDGFTKCCHEILCGVE